MKKLFLFFGMLLLLTMCKHEPELTTPIDPPPPPPPPPNGIPCDPDTVYFQNTVLPLLTSSCAKSGCHDAATQEDGVLLTNYSSIINTGEVVPGNPGESKIYEKITDPDPEERMPPPPENPLTTEQIQSIYKWILQGAKDNYCDSDCDTTDVTYSGNIQPFLQNHCVGCHTGSSGGGGIDLSTHAGVAGAASSGRLLGAIRHETGYSFMPQNGNQLSECQIRMFELWVAAGSPDNK